MLKERLRFVYCIDDIMSQELINNLLSALEVSPNNIPLRSQVAELLLEAKQYEEAIVHFQKILNLDYGNRLAQQGLANCYFELGKYSAAIVIYEQMQPIHDDPTLLRFIQTLIKEGSKQQASHIYKEFLETHPGFKNAEIDAALRIPGNFQFEEEDVDDLLESLEDESFMERPDLKFSDVGGMDHVKKEISLKIIQPIKHPDLYKAFGKKSGGGILLYGPPGCGKTFIAKATAGEIDAKFIAIGIHEILDMWIGNSEKNLHEIFETARRNKPVVLFFDEVDAMGASRNDMKHSAMRHLINQFLLELDGVVADNEGVLILAATNAPWNVDAAFRRPGRFDRIIFVAPPDFNARIQIITSLISNKPVQKIDIEQLAKLTESYSGADLNAIIDIATEKKLQDSMETGALSPISQKDLLQALKAHKPTTLEWFQAAKNYALYSNDSGLYNDILQYLKISK